MNRKSKISDSQLELPALDYFIPVVKVPQPDGSLLIKAGKPQVVEGEVSCAEFARLTGLSHSYVTELCSQGQIVNRPLTPKKKSKRMIPRSEVQRYKTLGLTTDNEN